MKFDYDSLQKYINYIEKKESLKSLQREERDKIEEELKKQRDNFEKVQRKKRKNWIMI